MRKPEVGQQVIGHDPVRKMNMLPDGTWMPASPPGAIETKISWQELLGATVKPDPVFNDMGGTFGQAGEAKILDVYVDHWYLVHVVLDVDVFYEDGQPYYDTTGYYTYRFLPVSQ